MNELAIRKFEIQRTPPALLPTHVSQVSRQEHAGTILGLDFKLETGYSTELTTCIETTVCYSMNGFTVGESDDYVMKVSGASVVVERLWRRVTVPAIREFKRIARREKSLLDVSPRIFEQILALLIYAEGADVYVTPPSKDGGFDVVASKFRRCGRRDVLFAEAKRYKNPVGLAEAQRLSGVASRYRPDFMILAAATTITRGAKSWMADEGDWFKGVEGEELLRRIDHVYYNARWLLSHVQCQMSEMHRELVGEQVFIGGGYRVTFAIRWTFTIKISPNVRFLEASKRMGITQIEE